MLAPIVLFVYNRANHTRRTVEALQKNDLAKQSDLIIYSDGSVVGSSDQSVNEVRCYLETITGFNNVEIIRRSSNFGLAASIIDGVTSVVNKYGKVIVLEDDLITSPLFLKFMNDALEIYQDDDQVVCISGYVYPSKDTLPDTFFIRTAECWGWATWKRGWSIFEADSEKLLSELVEGRLIRDFNFNNSLQYTKMLQDQIGGKINSWAIRWYASAFLNNKLTLFPGQSLVNNIGFDCSGTHCSPTDVFDTNLAEKINLHRIDIVENLDARKKIEKYFLSIRRKMVIGRLKSLNFFTVLKKIIGK